MTVSVVVLTNCTCLVRSFLSCACACLVVCVVCLFVCSFDYEQMSVCGIGHVYRSTDSASPVFPAPAVQWDNVIAQIAALVEKAVAE